MIELESVKPSEFAWVFGEEIEIRLVNCDTKKEAKKKLEQFIDMIRRESKFIDIKIG